MSEDGGAFSPGVDRWVAGLGRLRDVVRQHVLATQLSQVLTQGCPVRARVLDVGCGQGTQSLRLARAGHEVTGVDVSEELLSRFADSLALEPEPVRHRVRLIKGSGEALPRLAPGPFDVVLCHGVLMYLEDVRPLLGALSQVAADRATLSLLVRNGLAMAMRDGLRGNWGDALVAFDRPDYVNRLGLRARAHTPEALDAVVGAWGWRRDSWHGVRVFTDHCRDGVPPPAELAPLLAAEVLAGGRDPYRQVAALVHLVYRRGEA